MIVDALVVLAGYLIGSVPFGYVVPRVFRGADIRKVGSGNVGASNVFRSFGKRLGVTVALLDVAKGYAPAAIGLAVGGDWVGILAGAAAMVGHARPLWLGLGRGGKMVATAGGVAFALAPLAAFACLVLFGIVFLLFRYASVASLVSTTALPFAFFFISNESWPVVGFGAVATLGVFVLHRKNMSRLRHGTEPRFVLRKPRPA